MSHDLKNLSLEELNQLQGDIKLEMESRQSQLKVELVNEFKEKAKMAGFTLDELIGKQSSRGSRASTGKVAPKYCHPDDRTLTWTGRGKRPRWVADLLAAGRELSNV